VSDTAFVEEGVGRDATFREKKKSFFSTLSSLINRNISARASACLPRANLRLSRILLKPRAASEV